MSGSGSPGPDSFGTPTVVTELSVTCCLGKVLCATRNPLHNARRARTPIVNVVGDHATYHLEYDAPLTSDIDSLARPMSHWLAAPRKSVTKPAKHTQPQ